MSTLLWPAINLGVLLSIIGYFLREPLKQFASERHRTMREELASVREQLARAQKQYGEFTARLGALDTEIAAIRDQMKQEAASSKARIVEEAKKSAARIQSDSNTAAKALFGDLKQELYTELSSKVLEKAEGLLRERLTGDDRARIRQEFSRQVEAEAVQ
jgi:F0F1-type ATP synthase membrane subunit b/b'